MLPVKKQTHEFRTLEEIRQRKDELADEIQQDNGKFTSLWNQVFIKKEGNTRIPVWEIQEKETQIIRFPQSVRRMPVGCQLAVFY